jgi:hypothetical protein
MHIGFALLKKKEDIGKFKGDLRSIEVQDEASYSDEYDENKENTKPTATAAASKSFSKGPTNQKSAANEPSTSKKPSTGGLFSSLKSLVGSKTLSIEAIQPVMEKMQDHLIGTFMSYFQTYQHNNIRQ